MIYFTADQHYYHSNIIVHCDRPFATMQKMNKELIRRHNEVVEKNDKVFIVGDFYFERSIEQLRKLVSSLNGELHLVLGNHDYLRPFDYVDCGIATVHTALQVEEFFLAHDPALSQIYNRKFKFITGHIHNHWKVLGNCVNVGVDVWGFAPVSIDTARMEFENAKTD